MKVGRPHRALWPSSLRVEQMPWRSSRANSTMALQRDAWRYGHATKTTTQRHCMGGCGALSALGVVDTELEPVARVLRSDVRWCWPRWRVRHAGLPSSTSTLKDTG